jgi:hypothetical protein
LRAEILSLFSLGIGKDSKKKVQIKRMQRQASLKQCGPHSAGNSQPTV